MSDKPVKSVDMVAAQVVAKVRLKAVETVVCQKGLSLGNVIAASSCVLSGVALLD